MDGKNDMNKVNNKSNGNNSFPSQPNKFINNYKKNSSDSSNLKDTVQRGQKQNDLINKQNELLSKVRKASGPRISRNDIENIEIPLPPLDEQERIVRILDSLNELANGLSAGIPKEIELRQKQYEYWRDRLLEFPSKDSK